MAASPALSRIALRTALAILPLAPLAAQEEAPSHDRPPPPPPEEIAALPPDGGDEFNRLVFELSPYLLQHARNPIDWYAWGEEAFERATREDKPVFLSVGYSTCHWCHVMERESFEDAEVAALLNASFVCIKVDREERPDIDQVYMSYTQAVTGRGGWPMTVVMTPDKRPFFGGTYFPKTGRFGRPGMMELVPELARAWLEDREEVLKNAELAVTVLSRMQSGNPGELLGEETLRRAYAQLSSTFDRSAGGFGQAPKFPVPHNLRLLLRYHRRSGEPFALKMVEQTLDAMRAGGIWDHLGHGFHRYSTDAVWLLPHFEKMLYDQALIAMACTEAWQVTGEERHARTAREIFTYVLRDMTSPEGAFYSAEDADSEGEEGLFYVWTLAELEAALDEEDAQLAAAFWQVRAEGNFRDEASGQASGRNVLHRRGDVESFAAGANLEPDELAERLESIRRRLFELREARVHPLKDDKVLTDWNGLMIAALSKAARALDPAYAEPARRAADFALTRLRDDEGRLFKRYRQGTAGLPAMIEDYAFLVWGLIELYEATFEARFLAAAVELTDVCIEHFWDAELGGFFLSPDDGEALIVRAKEIYDGALPSGNSVMAGNLLRLSRITARERYEELAEGIVKAFSRDVSRSPASYPQLLCALDFAVGPSFEVVVAGDPAAEDTRAMLEALGREFLPNHVALLRPLEGEAPELARLAPYVAPQVAKDGKATAYVCRDFSCRAPTNEVAEMLGALREE